MTEITYATTNGTPASGVTAATAIAAAVLAAVIALAVTVWNRRRAKRVLKSLDRMLDRAMAGTFA